MESDSDILKLLEQEFGEPRQHGLLWNIGHEALIIAALAGVMVFILGVALFKWWLLVELWRVVFG